jgi:hypothetical protein
MPVGEANSREEPSADEAQLNARMVSTLLAAWIVPGAGHFMLGKRQRAVIFLAIIIVAITVGCLLDGNLYRIVQNQPLTVLATFGSMGMGAPYFILRFIFGYEGDVIAAGYEYGSAFLLTAGLMNLLLILDTWDLLRGRKT